MWLRLAFVVTVLSITLDGASALAVPDALLPPAIAQNEGRPNRPDRGMQSWIGELNLTPDQMQRMQAIRSRYQNQISQRTQALRQAETELQQLMASNVDSNQIRAKHNQVQSLRQQLAQVRFEIMLEMREVLTPEQRRQLAERMTHRRQNFRDRRMR
ncbi:MAG TPA: Spy protein [Cyanobacteria bacterium UBA11369]|nr:Spy protein [Cyanobacteria bacterium UBA8553]HAZ43229.1 Spy protein [Cyanobacteria bacterium UBA11371]HBE33492.1 Spy protein [Cyanobacteria bacterium UBA11368]HBE54351.1 Spy protein [Cyanobacteria bacterium UBA11369]